MIRCNVIYDIMSKVDILNTFFVRINVDIIFLKIMQQSFICNPFLKIFNCTYITINLYLSIKVIYQTYLYQISLIFSFKYSNIEKNYLTFLE